MQPLKILIHLRIDTGPGTVVGLFASLSILILFFFSSIKRDEIIFIGHSTGGKCHYLIMYSIHNGGRFAVDSQWSRSDAKRRYYVHSNNPESQLKH